MAFGQAPWRCVGLAALVLISGAGLAVIGQDLRQLDSPWLERLGDLAVLLSLVLPVLPMLALLELADSLLPAGDSSRLEVPWPWILRQSLALLMLEGLVMLGGIAVIQSLSWIIGQISTTLAGLAVIVSGVLLLSWMFSQVLALPLLIHHRHRALQAMDHSRQLVGGNALKVLALLGLITGLNLLGLIGASLASAQPSLQRACPDGLLPHSNTMEE